MIPLEDSLEALWRVVHERPELFAQVGAMLGGLALVALALRARASAALRVGVWQDAAYLVSRALVTLPLTIALLAGLGHLVTRAAPWIQIGWLPSLPWWAQLAVYVVLMDAVAYAVHRAFHGVPWLWHFHAVHHSQRALNALTTTRTHLAELLVKRVVTWAPLAILGAPTITLAWFVLLDGLWGFLVHSGLRVPLGPLRYVLVEPGYHRLHHSRLAEHHHANFAERLVIWDLVLGCARFDDEPSLETGIDDPAFPREEREGPRAAARTWLAQLAYPFRRILGRA